MHCGAEVTESSTNKQHHHGTDQQSNGRLSSSLPLQRDPYTSASPRSLRAPQRALNAFSFTPTRSSCALPPPCFLAQPPSPPHQCPLTTHFLLCSFSRAHPLLHGVDRVLAPPPAHIRLLHSSLLRRMTIAIRRGGCDSAPPRPVFSVRNRGYLRLLVLRALHAQPLLPLFSFSEKENRGSNSCA